MKITVKELLQGYAAGERDFIGVDYFYFLSGGCFILLCQNERWDLAIPVFNFI